MLCSKCCKSEAKLFYRTNRLIQPLCLECYFSRSNLNQEDQEFLKKLLETDGPGSGTSGP